MMDDCESVMSLNASFIIIVTDPADVIRGTRDKFHRESRTFVNDNVSLWVRDN